MASYPTTPKAYPVTPKAYPVTPKAYPGSGLAKYPGADGTSLLNLPNADKLAAWWDVEYGITLDSAMQSSGTTPPAITMSGNLSQCASIRIECTGTGGVGVGTIRISLYSGATYYVDQYGDAYNGVVPASPLTLSNGITLTFPNSTYTSDNVWLAKVSSWASRGLNANCTLDTATLGTAGPIPVYNAMMNRGYALYFNGHMLANQNGVPAIASGLNIPLGLMMWMRIDELASGAQALVPWAFSNQAQTTKDILDVFFSGPTATPASAWGFQRRDNVPNATKVASSSAVPDLSWHTNYWDFDGTSATFFRNNIADGAAQNIATAGTTLLDRFTVGGSKFGGAAMSNGCKIYLSGLAIWNAAKSAADRTAITLGRS